MKTLRNITLDFTQASTSQDILEQLNKVEKLAKRLRDAVENASVEPSQTYVVNYLYGLTGTSHVISQDDLQCSIPERQVLPIFQKLGVPELQGKENDNVQFNFSTLEYQIEKAMDDGSGRTVLQISGEEIRYMDKGVMKPFPNSVKVILTRMPITKEDYKTAEENEYKTALGAILGGNEYETVESKVFSFPF